MRSAIAPELWRRMAAENPASIRESIMATHPSTPERAVALRKAIDEIASKVADGRPFEPEVDVGAGIRLAKQSER